MFFCINQHTLTHTLKKNDVFKQALSPDCTTANETFLMWWCTQALKYLTAFKTFPAGGLACSATIAGVLLQETWKGLVAFLKLLLDAQSFHSSIWQQERASCTGSFQAKAISQPASFSQISTLPPLLICKNLCKQMPKASKYLLFIRNLTDFRLALALLLNIVYHLKLPQSASFSSLLTG